MASGYSASAAAHDFAKKNHLNTIVEYGTSGVGSNTLFQCHLKLISQQSGAIVEDSFGVDRSKRIAKQNAAANILRKLNIDFTLNSPDNTGVCENDYIGALNTYCQRVRLPLPTYLIRPNLDGFVCTCSIRDVSVQGRGKCKKQAKRMASYQMLARLIPQMARPTGDTRTDPSETREENSSTSPAEEGVSGERCESGPEEKRKSGSTDENSNNPKQTNRENDKKSIHCMDFQLSPAYMLKNPVATHIMLKLYKVVHGHIRKFAESLGCTKSEYFSAINAWHSPSEMFDSIELWLLTSFQKTLETVCKSKLSHISSFVFRANDLESDELQPDAHEFSVWLPLFASDYPDKLFFGKDDDGNKGVYHINANHSLALHHSVRLHFKGMSDETVDRYYLVSLWKRAEASIAATEKTERQAFSEDIVRDLIVEGLIARGKELDGSSSLEKCLNELTATLRGDGELTEAADQMLKRFRLETMAKRRHNACDITSKNYDVLWKYMLLPILEDWMSVNGTK